MNSDDQPLQCCRCRHKLLSKERVDQPRKRERGAWDHVCPRCGCKTFLVLKEAERVSAPAVETVIADGPLKALSIRQPWAWLIVHGPKRFENRLWSPANPARREARTGMRFLIHASKGMTGAEYAEAFIMARERGVILPAFGGLQCGGIVGSAEIVRWHDVRLEGHSWSFGSGLELTNVQPMEFRPCKGALGFFKPVYPEVFQPRLL